MKPPKGILESMIEKNAQVTTDPVFVVSTQRDGPVGLMSSDCEDPNDRTIAWFNPMFDVSASDFLTIEVVNVVIDPES